MSTRTQRQNLYGTAAEIAAYTGVAREVLYDTTNNYLVLTDGVMVGGIAIIPNKAYVDAKVAGIAANAGAVYAQFLSCI